jgi:hypothetical protein
MTIIKINLEKVKEALQILSDAVEYGGGDVTYKVEAACNETVLIATKEADIELPIQVAVRLARDLLQIYVDVWNDVKKKLEKFETGVWL